MCLDFHIITSPENTATSASVPGRHRGWGLCHPLVQLSARYIIMWDKSAGTTMRRGADIQSSSLYVADREWLLFVSDVRMHAAV